MVDAQIDPVPVRLKLLPQQLQICNVHGHHKLGRKVLPGLRGHHKASIFFRDLIGTQQPGPFAQGRQGVLEGKAGAQGVPVAEDVDILRLLEQLGSGKQISPHGVPSL